MIPLKTRLNDLKRCMDQISKVNQAGKSGPISDTQMVQFWSQLKSFSTLYGELSSVEFSAEEVLPNLDTIRKLQYQVCDFFQHSQNESFLCDQILSNHKIIQNHLIQVRNTHVEELTPETTKLSVFRADESISIVARHKERYPDRSIVIQNPEDDGSTHLPSKLEELDLLYCSLPQALLHNISTLNKLRDLYIYGCHSFSDEQMASFSNLKELRSFTCDSSTDGSGLYYLSGLTHLRKLDMEVNPEHLPLLKYFPELKSLHVYNLSLAPEGMKQVAKLSQLKKLHIDNANRSVFVDESAEPLTALENLESLTIRRCRAVTNRTLKHVGKITSLRKLCLQGINIDDEGVRHLSNCVNLECLEITRTFMSDQALHSLKYLSKLKKLTLRSSDITQEGVKILVEFPELEAVVLGGTAFWKEEARKKAIEFGQEHNINIQCPC